MSAGSPLGITRVIAPRVCWQFSYVKKPPWRELSGVFAFNRFGRVSPEEASNRRMRVGYERGSLLVGFSSKVQQNGDRGVIVASDPVKIKARGQNSSVTPSLYS